MNITSKTDLAVYLAEQDIRPEVIVSATGYKDRKVLGAAFRRRGRHDLTAKLAEPTGEQHLAYLVEDVEWLLDMETDPDTIPERLGYAAQHHKNNLMSLRDELNRAGRSDLAARFYTDRYYNTELKYESEAA